MLLACSSSNLRKWELKMFDYLDWLFATLRYLTDLLTTRPFGEIFLRSRRQSLVELGCWKTSLVECLPGAWGCWDCARLLLRNRPIWNLYRKRACSAMSLIFSVSRWRARVWFPFVGMMQTLAAAWDHRWGNKPSHCATNISPANNRSNSRNKPVIMQKWPHTLRYS